MLILGKMNAKFNKSIKIKKGRGSAKFPKEWGTGKKLDVTLDKYCRVIGPDVNKYSTAVGCVAKIGVKLPLNYVKFPHIPQYLRDMAWDEIEVRSIIALFNITTYDVIFANMVNG